MPRRVLLSSWVNPIRQSEPHEANRPRRSVHLAFPILMAAIFSAVAAWRLVGG